VLSVHGAGVEQRFDTRVAEADAWEYWSEVTRTAFVAMRASAPDGDAARGFRARAASHDVGGLRVATMAADPHRATRTPGLVRNEEAEDFFVTLVVRGSVAVCQDERLIELGAGDYALVDSTRPFDFHIAGRYQSVVVQVPRPMLISRCPTAEHATATSLGTVPGIGAFAGKVFRALGEEIGQLDAGTANVLTTQLVELLADVVSARPGTQTATGSGAAHRQDLRRAKAYLSANLHDDHLTLLAASLQLGFSLRYLHQLFSEVDATPRSWLFEQRLDRARQLLVQQDADSTTLAEIAARVGFKDPSHFSRAFRRRFGTSPGALRRTPGLR
jgi:AraC-like DNA-binding protein